MCLNIGSGHALAVSAGNLSYWHALFSYAIVSVLNWFFALANFDLIVIYGLVANMIKVSEPFSKLSLTT